MEDKLDFEIRAYVPTDEAFVMDSWKQSMMHVYTWVPRDTYYRVMDRALARILGNSQVLVAHEPADHNQIYGWICFGEDCVHYCFVKQAFRLQGIGKALLDASGVPDAPVIATHWSRGAEKVALDDNLIVYCPSKVEKIYVAYSEK